VTFDESQQHRVEPPSFFRAPSIIEEDEAMCINCGQPILPGEQVVLTEDDQYLHRGCFEVDVEDQMEGLRYDER
jgi:hypothetical protein